MFKIKPVIVVITFFTILLFPLVAYALTYSDDEAQIEFTIPIGWTEEALSKPRDVIDVKYVFNNSDSVEVITFGFGDVWGAIPEDELYGLSRNEMDNSYFTSSDIAYMYELDESEVSITSYNGIQYYKTNIVEPTTYLGVTLVLNTVQLIRIYNGYMYFFMYGSLPEADYHYNDFEELMNSVKYTALVSPEQSATASEESQATKYQSSSKSISETSSNPLSAENILLSLIGTIVIYSLPIIIYRFGIRRKPMEKRKAKWISIIYGICSFISMSAILYFIGGAVATGASVILWGYINYRMLIVGGIEKMPETELNNIKNNLEEQLVSEEAKNETTQSSELKERMMEKGTEEYKLEHITTENQLNSEDEIHVNGSEGEGYVIKNDNLNRNDTVQDENNQIFEKINHLSKLYKLGALTKKEYSAAKKNLLDKL